MSTLILTEHRTILLLSGLIASCSSHHRLSSVRGGGGEARRRARGSDGPTSRTCRASCPVRYALNSNTLLNGFAQPYVDLLPPRPTDVGRGYRRLHHTRATRSVPTGPDQECALLPIRHAAQPWNRPYAACEYTNWYTARRCMPPAVRQIAPPRSASPCHGPDLNVHRCTGCTESQLTPPICTDSHARRRRCSLGVSAPYP